MKFILFFIAAMLGHALAASQGASSLRRKLTGESTGSPSSYLVQTSYLDATCSKQLSQTTVYGGICTPSGSDSTSSAYTISGSTITQTPTLYTGSTTCSGTGAAKTTSTFTTTCTSGMAYSSPGSEPTLYGLTVTSYSDTTACTGSATSRTVYSLSSGQCIAPLSGGSLTVTNADNKITQTVYTSTDCSGTGTAGTPITLGACNSGSVYTWTTAPSGPNLKLLALLVLLVIPIGLGVVWYLRRQGKCGGKAPEPVPTSEAEAAAKTTDNEVALVPTGESAEEPKA